MTNDSIYLDHAATTPVRPEVWAAMEPFLTEQFGNPSSVHAPGRAARGALEEARERVAAVLGAERSEVVFTAGGTESDNLAILGRWRSHGQGLVISAVEHSAVRESAAQAAREGAALTTLAVDEQGRVDLAALDEALHEPQSVVSVMWGNNEVGTLQPVGRIAEVCRDRGVAFHTDAVQAVGHVPVSVREVPCDLLALSAHKFGGPRGVGALYIRRGVAVHPVLHGGGQEGGLRAGTSNVAGALGLAVALELAAADLAEAAAGHSGLRDRLEKALISRLHGAEVLAGAAERLPHVLTLGLDDVGADVLLPALDLAGLAVSSGSACRSGAASPSPVLLAMGRQYDAMVRFSVGWTTTEAMVDRAADTFVRVVERARAMATR